MLKMIRLDTAKTAVGFEQDYIRDCLLCGLADDIAPEGAEGATPFIVYSSDRPELHGYRADTVHAAESPLLLHLSNEHLNHDHSYYAKARWVFRSYYDPNCAHANVTTLPLGYRSGYPEAVRALPNRDAPRDNVWAFAGQVKGDRTSMVQALGQLTPHFVHGTSGWLTDDNLSTEQLCAVYSRTWFAPCPMGTVHPDSYRVMEALENGCIPVLVRFFGHDVMKFTFGDHPFIVGADWIDAASQMQALLQDDAALQARARAVQDWYARFKADLAFNVTHIVRAGGTAGCRGAQFAYQQAGRADPRLRAVFALHFRRMAGVK